MGNTIGYGHGYGNQWTDEIQKFCVVMVCDVCGKNFVVHSQKHTYKHKKRTSGSFYWHCSWKCHREFEKRPDFKKKVAGIKGDTRGYEVYGLGPLK